MINLAEEAFEKRHENGKQIIAAIAIIDMMIKCDPKTMREPVNHTDALVKLKDYIKQSVKTEFESGFRAGMRKAIER